jgi:hypothetical protein
MTESREKWSPVPEFEAGRARSWLEALAVALEACLEKRQPSALDCNLIGIDQRAREISSASILGVK